MIRHLIAVCLCALICFSAASISAHAPFDCSARVIVHADSAEVIVMTGADLAVNILQTAGIKSSPLIAGRRPAALPLSLAAGFFDVSADGKTLSPQMVDVVGDGLEFSFRMVYPLATTPSLRLNAKFLPALLAPRSLALVVCDENNNILGTAILSPQKDTADFTLPARLFPAVTATESPLLTLPTRLKTPSPVPVEARARPGFMEFLRLGIGHILTGFDHLLFLCALLLGCRRLKPMLLVITGFTLAHSVTLALAALEVVTLSPRVVEPLIALSIVIAAAKNLMGAEKPWYLYVLTCGFGLVHGFGFAGALRATGLAANGAELALPLFAFNLGVEVGQLAVAAVFLPVLFGLRRWPLFERQGTRVVSVIVIVVSAGWLGQRLAIR